MATTTFYPDAGITAEDGQARRTLVDETFATIRNGAGNASTDNGSTGEAALLRGSATPSQYSRMFRGIIMFDTSSLGSSAVVDSATLSIYGSSKANDFLDTAHIPLAIVSTTTSAATSITSSDYNIANFGSTRLATDIAYASFSTTGYNDFALNASGIANININAVSKFGFRLAVDVDNGTPANAGGTGSAGYIIFLSENTGTTKDPKLVVTYHYNLSGGGSISGSSTSSGTGETTRVAAAVTAAGDAAAEGFESDVQRIEANAMRKIAANLLVSWKKDFRSMATFFTIGVSTIGGIDGIKSEGGVISDWNNYQYDDESDNVLWLDWESQLNMPIGGLTMALADGRLSNTSGRYSPESIGGSSELFTAILPRRPFIINAGFNYGGIDNLVPQFVGVFNRQPKVNLRERYLDFQGADFIDFLQNRKIDNTVMFTGVRTDEIIERFLTDMGFATSQFDLDAGINNIPFALFERGKSFSNAVNDLVQAENGHFYQDREGTLRFENRQHWDSSPHNSISRILSTAQVLEAEAPDEDHIINVVEIKSKIRNKQPEQTIFKLVVTDAIEISASGTKELFVDFEDPALSVTTPTSSGTTSFFKANTSSDGTGTDVSSSVTITSATAFAKAAKFIFSNASTSTVYLTELVISGRPAKVQSEIYLRAQDDSSVTAYEERQYVVENDYIQSESWANSLAQMVLNDFAEPEKLQRITIRAIPALQLGDLVSWQGRSWRIFNMKTTLSPSVGFTQELLLLQREITSYFIIGVSLIGSDARIAP